MLPSSPYTMLKLSKTTSPNELLHNHRVTLFAMVPANTDLARNHQIGGVFNCWIIFFHV